MTMKKSSRFVFSCLCFGFAFLYLPILVLILYSFNQSAISSVWGGFSLRWYTALFNNDQIIESALLSLKIAATSATFATILGTMAGIGPDPNGPIPWPIHIHWSYRSSPCHARSNYRSVTIVDVREPARVDWLADVPRRRHHNHCSHNFFYGVCSRNCAISLE